MPLFVNTNSITVVADSSFVFLSTKLFSERGPRPFKRATEKISKVLTWLTWYENSQEHNESEQKKIEGFLYPSPCHFSPLKQRT